MRILITTDVLGGVWDHTVTLVRELADAGDECLVAVIGAPSAAHLRQLPHNVEVEYGDFLLEWMPDAERDIASATAWLRGLAGRWGAELVHFNQFAYSAVDHDVPVVVVAHSDVCSWHAEVTGQEAPAEWDSYRARVRAGLRAADRIVAPSRYQSDLLARHFGQPAHHVIHNGIGSGSRRDLPPASARPWICSAGRAWDPAKGMATLERAARMLGDAGPPIRVAGPLQGPDNTRFDPGRLVALGPRSRADMDRLFASTAIYVGTSLYEPFGLAPLEAADHGCALVLSDLGSFRELWDDVAAFFPPGDADALAGCLRDLVRDPARMDEMGRSARRRAGGRYTATAMATAYRRLYADLVETRHATRVEGQAV